jgi:hypothetical protein
MYHATSTAVDVPSEAVNILAPEMILVPIHTGPKPAKKLNDAKRHDAKVAAIVKANVAFDVASLERSRSAYISVATHIRIRIDVKILVETQSHTGLINQPPSSFCNIRLKATHRRLRIPDLRAGDDSPLSIDDALTLPWTVDVIASLGLSGFSNYGPSPGRGDAGLDGAVEFLLMLLSGSGQHPRASGY